MDAYTVIQLVCGAVLIIMFPALMFWADKMGGR